jgi:hypothetical protein
MHDDNGSQADQPVNKADVLANELADEASSAASELKPLYRWLVETAAAKSPMPRWGSRPLYGKIAKEIGKNTKYVGERYAPTINRWYPRFLEAFSPEVTRKKKLPAVMSHVLPDVTDGGGAAALADPETRDTLIRHLEAAKLGASDRHGLAYDWLIMRAQACASFPTHGSRPNMRAAASLMGVNYTQALVFTEIFTHWLPRFDGTPTNSIVRRNQLPGSDKKGVQVPTGLLLKAMNEALRVEDHEDGRRLLSHLITLAEGDRKVPRSHASPSRIRLLSDAGVQDSVVPFVTNRIMNDWVEFFHLDDVYSIRSSDGSFKEKRVVSEAVKKYVSELRDANMTPLQRDFRDPDAISFIAVNRALNLTGFGSSVGESQKILKDYRDECARHHSNDGLGDKAQTLTPDQRRERTERRNGLITFCKEELDAGRLLPGRPGKTKILDYAELERRYGRPGLNLSTDSHFKTLLRRLKPKFASSDAVTVPLTYGQLLAEAQADRVVNVSASSAPVLRSRVSSAIRAFAQARGKDVTSLVGDDFLDKNFTDTRDAVIATGGAPKAFGSDINTVKSFLDGRVSRSLLCVDFDIILSNAVAADHRSLVDIVAETGISTAQVNGWIRRTDEPSRHHIGGIAKLEQSLRLEEGCLTSKVDMAVSRRIISSELPTGARAFLPDDYQQRDPEEVKAMLKWINENLLHQNTDFGRAMLSSPHRVVRVNS